ncbi:MAG: hypothetical protein RJB08_918 [Actinomycetota bacterium]|jgi:peptidoglycan/LPS O-acetylase OafA/YrhL
MKEHFAVTAREGNFQPPSMGYVPALDGLRALAVIAVVLYHAKFSWMQGGFIGVEVFFVVSGFLITSLLLEEAEENHSVALKQFWFRRGRRLLPALFAMLVTVGAWALLFSDYKVGQLRHDFLSAVFYISNWWQIFFTDVPYFAPKDPPLLRHLWSLAVEEQWYLLWPFAFIGLMRWRRSRAKSAQTLVIASFVVMLLTAVLYSGSNPDRVNFLYLSTLTRSTGLMLGAAGALLWRPWTMTGKAKVAEIPEKTLSLAATLSAAVLLLMALSLTVDGAFLYRGGLAIVTIASLVVVAVAVHPNAIGVRKILGSTPLVEVGKRSYGLYLWHWPIFLFAGARESAGKFVFAMVVTVAVTEASYRFIEMPVRNGVIGRWRNILNDRDNEQRQDVLVTATSYGIAVIVLVASVGIALAATKPIDISMDQGPDQVFGATTTVPLEDPTQTTQPGVVAPTTTLPVLADPKRLLIVGDSQAKALAINQPAGIEKTFTVSNGSISGCGVYDAGTGISSKIDFKQNFDTCRGWEKKWAAAVKKNKAEIALVVLGAWEVLDVLHAGVNYAFFTPQADELFKRQVKVGIDALVAAGVPKVALLEVPCMRPQNVPGAGIPAIPERGDDTRTSHLNELLQQVAKENSKTTTFVKGPREWCTSSIIGTDLGYRWDGVHVYKPGAKLIMDTIAPTLLSL